MSDDLPSHASPALTATTNSQRPSYFPLDDTSNHIDSSRSTQNVQTSSSELRQGRAMATVFSPSAHPSAGAATPPPMLSPAITPPQTPGTGTPLHLRNAPSYPPTVAADRPPPKLLNRLPNVSCVVRARIPTTTGVEMFLHLYQNDIDNKEHLAIVFGDRIRSKSLDAPREGETEMDRMIRGAYVGRLHPGRMSSRVDAVASSAGSSGKASPLLRSLSAKKIGKVPQKDMSSISDVVTGNPAAPNGSAVASAALDGPIEGGSRSSDTSSQSPLVRIHSECYTGETVWSARCDCGEQLDEAARLMSLQSASTSGGVIIYLRQEGRGIGLSEKLKAYNLQDLGNDTVEANLLLRHPADARSYGLATAMLCDLSLGGDVGIRLLTNNPDKIRAVEGPGREVVVKERVAMVPLSWKTGGTAGFDSPEVGQYLRTKIEKMGHLLSGGL